MKTFFFSFRRKMISCISALLLTPFLLFSQPPTPAEIQASVDLGVTWLVAQQNANGSWGSNTQNNAAYTGFVLTKLCDYAYEHNYPSPFDAAYPYSANVISGYDYLFSNTKTHGPGLGLYMMEGTNDHHETYNAAICLMALSATLTSTRVISSTNPLVNGFTYARLADSMVVYFEWGQNDAGTPLGGWGYQPNDTWGSDNSHTGYVILGLRYAEAFFGATVPVGVKTKLNTWIDYIQHDASGGSGYNSPGYWINSLKTGNLLSEMSFYGDALGATRVQDALGYISAHWDDAGTGSTNNTGWDGHNQAMYCLMKGFESYSIDSILVGGVYRNWFEEFTTQLVASQTGTGYWNNGYWGDHITNTVWALFVLEKVAPVPPPLVPISNWAIIVGLLLIGAFIVTRYRRASRLA